MKNQLIAIFFYLLYLLAMMRPVLPVLEYYANYDYISAVLCENRDKPTMACNGKCYLMKQLEKSDTGAKLPESNVPSINIEDYPLSLIALFVKSKSVHIQDREHPLYFKRLIAYFNPLKLLKPPQ